MIAFHQPRQPSADDLSRCSRGTIGLTRFLAGILSLAALNAMAQSGSVTLAWDPVANSSLAGYNLYYGDASGAYTWSLDAGTNLTETIAGLTPGLTYYLASTSYDTNGNESAFSNEVTNRPPILPAITVQPLTQTAVAGASATLSVSATGDPPLGFQWMDGLAPIPGATASFLSWASAGDANAGSYTVLVINPWGGVTSSVAVLTVLDPPSILSQPQSQTVVATTTAVFSSTVAGTAPLVIQWDCGTTALAGATNSVLAWANVAASNAGNYYFTVSNAAGTVSSSVATLTVLSTNTIATVAGAYNGLFFQTNADGTPAVSEATAGFLGNCVVASNGAYSAKLYVGGQSYSLAGAFSISGNASATIPRTGAGSSNVTAVLQLDLIHGTRQMTGFISSTTAGSAWTAPLLGDLAANAFPQVVGASLLISPGLSANSPTNDGLAIGLVANSVLSLSGALGDTAAMSQTVPISKDGNVPLFVNLYTNGGLLEGWVNLAGGAATGNLTWIRPSGVLLPAGFPQGFDTVVQVTGAAYQQGLGQLGASGPGTYTFSSATSTSGWIVFQDTNGSQYYEQASGSGITVAANGSLTFWACAGSNNPAPSGVITVIELNANNPTLTSLYVSGLTGLQTFECESLKALTSINATGCTSLISLTCEYCGSTCPSINASNCTALASLSDVTSAATVPIQNATIATLPAFAIGTHTLYWSQYAPANPAGDAAAAAKGWTVNRQGG
jgi:hypothetical protein